MQKTNCRRISIFLFLFLAFQSFVSIVHGSTIQKIDTISQWIEYTENNCKLKDYVLVLNMHTAGEGASLVLNSMDLPGESMRGKIYSIEGKYAYLHQTMIKPPLGHIDAFVAIITEPVLESSDVGIFFLESAGTLDMCGHNTLAAATGLFEIGRTSGSAIKFDTAASGGGKEGVVEAKAVKNSKQQVEEVTIENVKSFPLNISGTIKDKVFGKIDYELSYGGNVFAIINIDAAEKPIEIIPSNIEKFLKAGDRIRTAINKELAAKGKISHKNFKGEKKLVELVEFYSSKVKNRDETADLHLKNVVIFGQEGNPQADRSPCGTGTSAKMALLNKHKQLSPGQTFIYESIIGTKFKGQFTSVTSEDSDEIIPYITAAAYITGTSQYIRSDLNNEYSIAALRSWKSIIDDHYGIKDHIKTVDYHIGEKGTRINYDYKNLMGKIQLTEDDIRYLGKIMTFEPRGYDDLVGAIIVPRDKTDAPNELKVHLVRGNTILSNNDWKQNHINAVAIAAVDLELVKPDSENNIKLKTANANIILRVAINEQGKVTKVIAPNGKNLGVAYLSAFSQLTIDRRDPLTYGFSLKDQ